MAFDSGVLLATFVIGIALDVWWRTQIRREVSAPVLDLLVRYAASGLILVIVGIVVFTSSGFYSRGRVYRSKYKALVVTQATLLTFLIFGAVAYAMRSLLAFPPPSAIAVSAACALPILLLSRLFSGVWKRLLQNPVEASDLAIQSGKPANEHRVLVIGGGGYVGSALIPQLLDAGHRVRILDSFMFGTDAIRPYLEHPNFEAVDADFRRIDEVVLGLRGVDSVVHLGGIVGDPACALDEELTIEVNLSATRAIAELAKAHGVGKFIFASTCSVYGASDEVMDERSRLNPVSLYAKTKIGSERELLDISNGSFRPTILRFGTVYGLSGRTRFDLVVNLLTAMAVKDGRITVFGPDQWRPFVHVADVAHAIRLALEAPAETVAGRVFNVGTNAQNKTLGQVGTIIKSKVPNAELVISGVDGDARNYRVDFTRIQRELGFEATWTLEEGISQVLGSMQSGVVSDYSNPEYSNVKRLQSMVATHSVEVQRIRHLDLLSSDTGWVEVGKGADGPSVEWTADGNSIRDIDGESR